MSYQCDDNFELFMEYAGKLSALIEESPTSNVAIIDDFNAGIDTQFFGMEEFYSYKEKTLQKRQSRETKYNTKKKYIYNYVQL